MAVITTFYFTPLVCHAPVPYSSLELSVERFGGHLPADIVFVNSIYDLRITALV